MKKNVKKIRQFLGTNTCEILMWFPSNLVCRVVYIEGIKYSTLQRKVSSASQTVHEGSQTVREGSFACNVATNFKLCARMGCIITYYVTRTQIANLLCKSPIHESVCEPVHEPFHAPRVSSWFMHFHASPTYALTYICTCRRSEAYELRTNSWGMNWFINWLMTWFMNWWVTKWLRFMRVIAFTKLINNSAINLRF